MLPTDLLEKAMRPAFLGIIGCGAMGRLIARHIREQLPGDAFGEDDGFGALFQGCDQLTKHIEIPPNFCAAGGRQELTGTVYTSFFRVSTPNHKKFTIFDEKQPKIRRCCAESVQKRADVGRRPAAAHRRRRVFAESGG